MVVMCVVRAGGVVREVVRSETRGGRARENMGERGGERGRVKACKGSQRRAAKSRYGLRYSEKSRCYQNVHTHTHTHYIATLLWMKLYTVEPLMDTLRLFKLSFIQIQSISMGRKQVYREVSFI